MHLLDARKTLLSMITTGLVKNATPHLTVLVLDVSNVATMNHVTGNVLSVNIKYGKEKNIVEIVE
jgi:hypothetical protein